MCICVRFVISDRSIRCWWRSHHMKNKTPFSVVKFQCSCAEPSSPSSLFARNIFFIFLVYKIFLQLQMIIFGLWFCDHTKHMRNFDRSKFLFNNSARWHMKYFAHSCVSWHFVMLNGVVIRLTQPIMVSVRENAIYAFVYSTVSRRRYRADSIAACFVFYFLLCSAFWQETETNKEISYPEICSFFVCEYLFLSNLRHPPASTESRTVNRF